MSAREEKTLPAGAIDALRSSEARFRAVVENSHDGIVFTDAESRILYRSPSYGRINGFTDEDRIGRSGFEMVHPDDVDDIRRRWTELIEHPEISFKAEYRIRHKDGSWRWIESRGSNLLADPSVMAVVVSSRDITEPKQAEMDRKQAAAALQASEARFRAVVENSYDGILFTDANARIQYRSPSFPLISGYSDNESLGHDGFAKMHPDDINTVRAQWGAMIQDPGFPLRVQYRIKHKDGSWRWIETAAKNLLQNKDIGAVVVTSRDITARKRAEEELTRAIEASASREKEFRALFEQASDAIFILDPSLPQSHIILDANLAACQSSGYAREELIGRPIADLNDPTNQGRVADRGYQVATGERVIFETVHQRKDGSRYPVEVSAQLVQRMGEPPLVFSIDRDITERKRAEQALRESEERYRLVVELSPDAVMVHRKGTIAFANASAARLFGASTPSDLVGTDIGRLIHPDFRQTVQARSRMIQEEGNTVPRQEQRCLRLDGTPFDIEASSAPIIWDGERSSLTLLRDISERKRTEEALNASEREKARLYADAQASATRYRDLVATLGEGVAIVDLKERFEFANSAAESVFGLPAGELLGRTLSEFLSPEDFTRVEAETRKRLRGETGSYEMTIHRLDGEIRQIEVIATPYRVESGEVTGSLAVFRDVSDLRRMEHERRELQEQLQQAQKMEAVGRLAGGVAHDFNNLLQVIVGYAEVALQSLTPETRLHAELQQILNAAHRSADLTRQLLTFARKQDVTPQVLNLNQRISSTLTMLRRLIGEEIRLVWEPEPNLWPVKVDPTQVDQILANLAANSRDAIAGVGSLTVTTSNATVDEQWCRTHVGWIPGEYAVVQMRDTGKGIPPEVLEHIFEPFFTTKGIGRGTGLGLATVYGIVKQNNGFIDVASTVGAGATFRLYFPRAEGSVAKEHAEAESIPSGSETILVVEDDESILSLIRGILGQLGYHLLVAKTPSQALEIVRQRSEPVALLVTDVVMPEMNGRELQRRVSRLLPGIKTLFMSGYTADVISQRGVEEEGGLFLQKPFSIIDIARKVRHVLDQK